MGRQFGRSISSVNVAFDLRHVFDCVRGTPCTPRAHGPRAHGPRAHGPRKQAEREGFEPSDPVSQVNSLAVSPIRPLSHLSWWTFVRSSAGCPFCLPVSGNRSGRRYWPERSDRRERVHQVSDHRQIVPCHEAPAGGRPHPVTAEQAQVRQALKGIDAKACNGRRESFWWSLRSVAQ
jgi:hypothetical protein